MTCIKPSKVCLIIEQAGPTAHCYELIWPLIIIIIIDSEQLGTLMTRRSDQEVLNFILKIWVSQKLFDKKKRFPCCTKWHPRHPPLLLGLRPPWPTHTHTHTRTHDLLTDKATKLHQQSTICATDSGFSDMHTEWRWSKFGGRVSVRRRSSPHVPLEGVVGPEEGVQQCRCMRLCVSVGKRV